jgi:hypothetical protein
MCDPSPLSSANIGLVYVFTRYVFIGALEHLTVTAPLHSNTSQPHLGQNDSSFITPQAPSSLTYTGAHWIVRGTGLKLPIRDTFAGTAYAESIDA